MHMQRILHVYPQLNCGGTEMVIYNLIKFGSRNTFKFDILVQRSGDNEQIFRDLGVEIHVVPFTTAADYKKRLAEFFRANAYLAVHAHTHSETPYVLAAAKRLGVRHCISHSHVARIDIPKYLWPLRIFRNFRYSANATDLCGCSLLALKWLFPTRWQSGHVIYNGIDLDKFKFDENVRNNIRNANGLKIETKVFINIGRCTPQKNQKFIIDLAKQQVDNDCVFLIIGDGPLFADLQNQIKKERLENVRLLGKRDDVAQWLCAADVFLFPSVYEGLGIVAIEAQASGLKVISTDQIPEEADMGLNLFKRVSLKNQAQWLSEMNAAINSNKARRQFSHDALSSKYNIRTVTKYLEQIYLK
jgi:glycosyltransferase involved in cell wall biosynthesis